eukprot:1350764-Alexandrium_andersonii.AAC.1
MGWLRLCQQRLAEVLAGLSGRGLVSWQMADSSPQGSYDWMMRAGVTVTELEAVSLRREAVRLIRDPAGPGEVEAVQALAAKLQLSTAVPCGIGSGRGSAWHKLHALVHGFRLQCPSWEAVATQVNSVVSWTTDLGVEASLPRLPTVSLRRLFPWIPGAETSVPDEGAGGSGGAEDEPFAFEPASDEPGDRAPAAVAPVSFAFGAADSLGSASSSADQAVQDGEGAEGPAEAAPAQVQPPTPPPPDPW